MRSKSDTNHPVSPDADSAEPVAGSEGSVDTSATGASAMGACSGCLGDQGIVNRLSRWCIHPEHVCDLGVALCITCRRAMVSVQQGEAFLQRLHRTTGKFFQSFTTIVDLGFLEDPESGPRWNEVAQNHVLLQTNQLVDFPSQSRFSQNFGCFLEGSSTDETVGLHGCFGDTKQLRTGRCTLGRLPLIVPPKPQSGHWFAQRSLSG